MIVFPFSNLDCNIFAKVLQKHEFSQQRSNHLTAIKNLVLSTQMKRSSKLESTFDSLGNKENEYNGRFVQSSHFIDTSSSKTCSQCKNKLPTQSKSPVNCGSRNEIDDEIQRIIDQQLRQSNFEQQKDSSIRDLHLMFQDMTLEPASSTSPIEKFKLLTVDPIIIPNIVLREQDPISLNFIKLLMAYNKLLKLVFEKNYQINITNFNRKLILERIDNAATVTQSSIDEDYYSSSSNYSATVEHEYPQNNDFEEFDETSIDGN